MWFLFAKFNAGTLPNSWLLKGYWWSTDGGCTSFEKNDMTNGTIIAIDVQLSPDGVHVYLFSRDESKTITSCGLHAVNSGMDLLEKEKKKRYLYRLNRYAKDNEIMDYIKSLMF